MSHNCHVEPVQKSATTEERATTATVVLEIVGMGCPNCAMRVRNSLVSLYGVVEAQVDHTEGIAKVSYNPDVLRIVDLADGVAAAGKDNGHRYLVLRIYTQEPSQVDLSSVESIPT